jgi:hypothetical protein
MAGKIGGKLIFKGANDAQQSLESGSIVTISNPHSVADGLLTAALGTLTFPIIKENVEAIVTVSEVKKFRAGKIYLLLGRNKNRYEIDLGKNENNRGAKRFSCFCCCFIEKTSNRRKKSRNCS